jgi:hypothetical protein
MKAANGSRRGLLILYCQVDMVYGGTCRKQLVAKGGGLGQHGELSPGVWSVPSVAS